MNFNKLSPAELEKLAYLSEECGEVVKAINKIIRHGYSSINPDAPQKGTNKIQLEKEIGDLFTAVNVLCKSHDLNNVTIVEHTNCKIIKYMHHQEDR